ncbi:hypothetical protein [Mycobacteroides abscessus]|uniref:hypothetical protein n=1 Tax=Mycobacteroides abscessus TaxID=36809 RepID=UPI0009418712|nr:hypothetical protein [Mycobacteroides abscessus]
MWIEEHAAVPATVPMISRVRWSTLLEQWAETDEGLDMLARDSLRVSTFLSIASVMARHGDGGTGRNIAVGNARIAAEAGWCERLVTTTRRVLIAAGWLYKSAEGVSSRTGRFNRPPIVHLTQPRPADRPRESSSIPVDNSVSGTQQAGRTCDLLRSKSVEDISLVPNKPKARRRALRNAKSSKTAAQRTRWVCAYRIADELIAKTVGLEGARGPVAAALNFSSLNLESWTAAKIKTALDVWGVAHRDVQGVVRQMDWPRQIDRPGAFLAYRLQYLPAEPEKPVQAYTPLPAPPRTGMGRSRAWAAITEHLSGLKHTRHQRQDCAPQDRGYVTTARPALRFGTP